MDQQSEQQPEKEQKFGVWNELVEAWVTRNQTEEEAQKSLEESRNGYLPHRPKVAEAFSVRPYDPDRLVARCIQCDKAYTQGQLDALSPESCPNCGNRGLPANPDLDVEVRLNWSELRILGIWAENWARKCDQEDPHSGYNCLRTVHAICHRLKAQHPELPELTLSGEIRALQAEGYRVETNFDARENLPPQLVSDQRILETPDQPDPDQP